MKSQSQERAATVSRVETLAGNHDRLVRAVQHTRRSWDQASSECLDKLDALERALRNQHSVLVDLAKQFNVTGPSPMLPEKRRKVG